MDNDEIQCSAITTPVWLRMLLLIHSSPILTVYNCVCKMQHSSWTIPTSF
ncbi:hypothetical protein ACRRTK_013624 [Alexandromys fortis]